MNRSPIERVGSPRGGGGAGRKSSPERSSYGKISSSYAPVSRAANSFSEHETAAKSGAGPAGNDRPSSWLADVRSSSQNKLSSPIGNDDSAGMRSPKAWAKPGMFNVASGSSAQIMQQSSPCLLGGLVQSQLEAMCKYCHLTGSVEQVLATGPQHDTTCKRWARSHPAKAKDDRESTAVAERGALSAPEGLSETDQKKKEMLHKQMLILKKQVKTKECESKRPNTRARMLTQSETLTRGEGSLKSSSCACRLRPTPTVLLQLQGQTRRKSPIATTVRDMKCQTARPILLRACLLFYCCLCAIPTNPHMFGYMRRIVNSLIGGW